MKEKILKIIPLLLLLMPLKIYASEYTEWTSDYDDTYKEVETQTRYKWFRVEKEGGYYSPNQAPSQYYLTDGKKEAQGPYSKWQYNCQMLSPNTYDIEYKEFYAYKKTEPARYITLYHQKENFAFKNIVLYIKGEETNYEVKKCPSCANGMYNLKENDSIVIDMLNFYELEDITLLLETDRPNEPITYGISISMDSKREKECANYTGETHIKDYKIDEKWLAKRRTTDIMPSPDPVNQTIFVDNYGLHNFCRYREYKQYYYYIKHVYYDDNYYETPPAEGYTKDVSNVKTYYRYKLSSKKTPEELEKDNKKDENEDQKEDTNKKDDTNKKEDTNTKEEPKNNDTNNTIKDLPTNPNPTIFVNTSISQTTSPEQINVKNTSSNNQEASIFPLVIMALILLLCLPKIMSNKVERIN